MILLHIALVLCVCERRDHLAVGAPAAPLVARLHRAVRAALGIPHVEIQGGLFLGQDAVGELVKGMWGGVWHTVGLQDVVVDFPLWDTVNISLSDVEEVSCNIDWKHSFLIDLINSKARIFALIGGGRSQNGVESYGSRFIVVSHRSCEEELLVVRVSEQTKSNDVLETISKSLESRSPCSQAVIGWDMSKENGLFTLSLHVSEDPFQPLEFITGIGKDLPEVPVHIVACLSSHSKHSGIVEELFVSLAFKLKILGIITGFAECLNRLLIEPGIPYSSQVLNHIVLRAREILDINREDIVIALKWKNHEIFSKCVLDLLSNDIVDVRDLLV